MNNVQCAQCNNRPACNSDSFFGNQLFCLEKDVRKWKAKKGMRVCEKGSCFIGVDKNEMGLVLGCGKCSKQINLTKCFNCSTPYCNDETKLSHTKCYHLVANIQPYEKKVKTCHPSYNSCYFARDIFWRVEQNCGECPLKFKNCVTCNDSSLCNEETLIPLTNTKITTSSSKSTTTTLLKKETISIGKVTTRRIAPKSSAQLNKIENILMVAITIYSLLTLIFYII
uniref:Uncharacterized protein n=1 Tax=Meloidogyne hapla TaxID=6305 RepID=A0A1I8BS29_MELHA